MIGEKRRPVQTIIYGLMTSFIYTCPISYPLNFRLCQFSLLYRNSKSTLMIISFRYTYVRQARLTLGNQRLGYKHPGACCSTAPCKPIYTGITVPEQTRGISTDAG
ncbi:Hypothetical_protein [Hexamita inflata]|uniref:Hypothetical_protein n=1 Tax=Hexamita inflata TaxID=28002 RepID=A0AA86UCY4_9EUKA|nr:Hypothetical protein HINF_LOCUS33827 [Hexamita inflata]